ncbi:MAG TPA: helix-turn-helix domain-containing protein [Jatrophihabitans sp.]|uniref:PucR family transcriptional regulator n=1 Tax=Jatrophihabitans sp. TaxID=1932789 RepID=UPI002E083501|nr:helix-turn-helix domain-containing protein [Jatrophihabitans sp.]
MTTTTGHDDRTTDARRRSLVLDPVLADLAAKAAQRLPELCVSVTAEIRAQMVVYGVGSTVPLTDLQGSVEGNLRTMIEALTDPDSIDLGQAHATGTRRAQQGAPLPEVLRAFRIGFSALWDLLLDVASGSGEPELRALIATATSFWFLIDEYLEAVTAAYRQATTELVRSQRERRATLLDALFSGGVVNERAMWDVAQMLDMPHDGVFVVIAAQSDDLGSALLPGFEQALAARHIGSAWRHTASYELGIASVGAVDRIADVAAVLTRHAKGRVGLSPGFIGLENTPRALRLAHVARSSVAQGEPWVACFEDSPLAMLVAAAPDEAVDIAHRVLRPVLALPPGERAMLLDTLESWTRHGGSTKRSSEELHCHPNTVRYRLQRLQAELKVSLTDPLAVALLVVALRSWRLFGNSKPLPIPE